MNPYDILGMQPGASNAAIATAAANTLKSRRFDARVVAEAQRVLLSPERRILADFLLPLLPAPRRYVFRSEAPAPLPLPQWPPLDFRTLRETVDAIIAADEREARRVVTDQMLPTEVSGQPGVDAGGQP